MALNKLSSLKKSYLYDWLIFIIMFILFQIINSFKAIERQFAIDDISISHPHKEDTIKMVYLLVNIKKKFKLLYIIKNI